MNQSQAACDLTTHLASGACRDLLIISRQAAPWAEWLQYLHRKGWRIRVLGSADEVRHFAPCLVFVEADSSEGFAAVREKLRQRGLENAAYCAILPRAEVQDVLACIRAGAGDVLLAPPDFQEAESVLERLAAQVSEKLSTHQALEKSNLDLQESLNILRMDHIAGREVQRSMLPKSPMAHGPYEIAHKIVPSLYLSGDFVGYNFLFNRYLLFYFADVSGHGASSAFITVLLRFHLNRIIRKHILGREELAVSRAPGGVMESINRLIFSIELDKHLTLFAGAIDMKRNILRYSMAAQVPPPLFVVDGDARFLHGKGKPLGLFEEAEWDVYEIALPERFALTLASDGVLDMLPGADLIAKEEHLLSLLAEAGGDFDRICAALDLEDASAGPDDMSVLSVIRRTV